MFTAGGVGAGVTSERSLDKKGFNSSALAWSFGIFTLPLIWLSMRAVNSASDGNSSASKRNNRSLSKNTDTRRCKGSVPWRRICLWIFFNGQRFTIEVFFAPLGKERGSL